LAQAIERAASRDHRQPQERAPPRRVVIGGTLPGLEKHFLQDVLGFAPAPQDTQHDPEKD
jgi:hypothetical protein